MHVLNDLGVGMKSEKRVSVRDAKKRRTRNILRNAALDLFLEHGYDATTTEEVAERAGVSVRTFFRYFDTKDEVLFKGRTSWAEEVAATFLKQPLQMNDMEAMCAAFVTLATGLNRRAALRYEEVIESSMLLRGRSLMVQKENAARLALAVAERRGLDAPDAGAELFGVVSVLLYGQAVNDWRLGTRDLPLEELVIEKFQLLSDLFRDQGLDLRELRHA